jgi:hypothetical protein
VLRVQARTPVSPTFHRESGSLLSVTYVFILNVVSVMVNALCKQISDRPLVGIFYQVKIFFKSESFLRVE